MHTDAEVGIGFFVGSLSTLRPLCSRRTGHVAIVCKAQGQELCDLPEEVCVSSQMDRPQEKTMADMERLSRIYRESEEEVEEAWPLPGKELR